MKESCELCRFWKRIYNGKDDDGECHRSQPARDGNGRGVWPITIEKDWCGDYEEGFDSD